MQGSRDGWFTPSLFTLVLLATSGLSAYFFLLGSFSEDSALLFTRYTARLSFFLFLPVFALSAWHRFFPSRASRLLMRHRRQLGLAFAFAHGVHLLGIVLFFKASETWFTADDIAAIVIYVLIGLMAITSNTLSLQRLGGTWKILHKVGLYGVFVGFFVTYLGRVQGYSASQLAPSLMDPFAIYVVLSVLVSAAWLLRIAAFWRVRL